MTRGLIWCGYDVWLDTQAAAPLTTLWSDTDSPITTSWTDSNSVITTTWTDSQYGAAGEFGP